MFSHFMIILKKTNRLIKDYFLTGRDEIAEKNIELLKLISFIVSVILFLFCTVVPFIYRSWSGVPTFLLFLLLFITFFAVSSQYSKSSQRDNKTVTFLCLLFELTVFVFTAAIDLSPHLKIGIVLLPVIYITFSTCFIFPLWQVFSVQIIVEILYIILATLAENPCADTKNISTSAAGFVISLVAGQIMLKSRAGDYALRMQYMRLSMTDSLTGILNKKACEDAISKYLKTAAKCRSVLLFLDLDNFKNVNDYIGHAAGDQILEETGKLLVESFRSTDIVGRVGGDEFMVLIKDFHGSETALKSKCTMLQYDMFQAMLCFSVESSCCIGAVLFQNINIEFQDVYKMADELLLKAKRSGKNQCIVYSIPEEK